MNSQPTIIERAFELAASGKIGSLAELRRQLSHEGFALANAHVQGAALTKQLGAIIRSAMPPVVAAG
ncbi:hypothetical protein sos41_22860 [Alphaproteobacteria bacterium SO-S41]|nr:hypothetical protein sos41_22860 [Alphaproteobacteria bacterium SO-S41]